MFAWLPALPPAELAGPMTAERAASLAVGLVAALDAATLDLPQLASWRRGAPLCVECMEGRVVELHAIAAAERKMEQSHAAVIADVAAIGATTLSAPLLAELAGQHATEATLRLQLAAADRDLAAAEAEHAALAAELVSVRKSRAQSERAAAFLEVARLERADAVAMLEARAATLGAELTALRRTNMYAEVCAVWADGHVVTANGLRLGRVAAGGAGASSSEINGAFGHGALLLQALGTKHGVAFVGYEVVPRASQSMVIRTDPSAWLRENPLHIGSALPLAERRFNAAVVGFASCTAQLCGALAAKLQAAAAAGSAAAAAVPARPFSVTASGERVGGYCVKYGASTEEEWAAGLKALMTLLKWAVLADAALDPPSPAPTLPPAPLFGAVCPRPRTGGVRGSMVLPEG